MRLEYTNDELLRAYDIVRQDIDDVAQMIDYYYSGDKDTLREAAENILRQENVPTELTHSAFVQYAELYSDKIDVEFDRLVAYGKVEQPKADTTREFLKQRHEQFLDERPSAKSFKIEYDFTDEDDLPF